MTNCRVESELVLVGGVPAELHSRVAIVDDLEGGCLGFTDDAITDVELVLEVVRQAFKSDSLIETFTDQKNLVLLENIVHGRESQ